MYYLFGLLPIVISIYIVILGNVLLPNKNDSDSFLPELGVLEHS